MHLSLRFFPLLCALFFATAAHAAETYTPKPGQPGKDVVWVPTPDALIERMLDIAQVTPRDFVIDLGSGDGRAVIAAAKRGANALGIEYEPELVELARERAAEAGVAGKARFERGDMFAADISKASVLVLFLMPENLDKLAPKFLKMKPGSRIAMNTYVVSGWKPDRSEVLQANDCEVWCQANLYIVPANVAGDWKLGNATLTLQQIFQDLRGTLTRDGKVTNIEDGRLSGERITFTAGGTRYEGRVEGGTMAGKRADGKSWTAARLRPAD